MPLEKLGALIAGADEFRNLSARTRRLRELQTLFERSAPRELASASRVRNLRAGTLVIVADNAGIASKLKQLTPTLLAAVRRSEAEVTALRIEVQVDRFTARRPAGARTKTLTADALEQFAELSGRVEGPLKGALERLVSHHRRARE